MCIFNLCQLGSRLEIFPTETSLMRFSTLVYFCRPSVRLNLQSRDVCSSRLKKKRFMTPTQNKKTNTNISNHVTNISIFIILYYYLFGTNVVCYIELTVLQTTI